MAITEAVSGRRMKGVAKRELVIEFEPDRLAAPFLLRCGAVIIDYVLFISAPVIGLILNHLFFQSVENAAGTLSNNTAWLIAILIGFCNCVLFAAMSGQTFGMMLTGLRIVTLKGEQPSFGRIALRNTLGYLLTLATLGLGFMIAAVSPLGRTLHDHLFGTLVIYGLKKRK